MSRHHLVAAGRFALAFLLAAALAFLLLHITAALAGERAATVLLVGLIALGAIVERTPDPGAIPEERNDP